MKQSTKRRKAASRHIPKVMGQDAFTEKLVKVVAECKAAFDSLSFELGRTLAEAIMYMDREQVSSPDYLPTSSEIQKWASRPGSVFIGDQKVKVERPRLRGPEGEIHLQSYQKLKERGQFSEELLASVLSGVSDRKYNETVDQAAQAFGVSKSSVSRHLVEATSKQLKEFSERDLSEFDPFAVFLDTVHRGGKAFIVALGIDLGWSKKNLGFWEGATENNEICKELLASLEERGLSKRVIFITDGGKGVIKALRDNKMSLTKKQRPLGIRNISGVHSQFQLKMRHSLNFGFQGFILERYL
jgi:putative transposase